MIDVFLRYDDYSTISPQAVDDALVRALERRGATCLWGVIPAVSVGDHHMPGDREELQLTREKAEYLHRVVTAGTIEVALHGWNHRTHAGALHPLPSEFAGLPMQLQRERLARGKALLEEAAGVSPIAFVPPWNSYDENTLAALESLGIQCVSAHRGGPSCPTLSFLPMTVELRGVRDAVAAARASGDPSPLIGVMMHPYDFRESGDHRSVVDFVEFEALLDELQGQSDVRFISLAEVAGAGRVDSARYRANQPSRLEPVFPPFVASTFRNPVLLTTGIARRQKQHKVALAIATHLFVGLVAAITAFGVGTMSGSGWAVISILAVSLGGITSVLLRSIRQREIYFKAFVALSLLTGTAVGSVWSLVAR